jgi:hypothetical protein
MCFGASLLERSSSNVVTPAKQAEYHRHLHDPGVRVNYALRASMAADISGLFLLKRRWRKLVQLRRARPLAGTCSGEAGCIFGSGIFSPNWCRAVTSMFSK